MEAGQTPAPRPEPGERRRSRRIKLEAIVHYQVDGSEFINLATNVSSEGIFIKNFTPPSVGSEVRIRASLPPELGGAPVHLLGKVIRVVDGVGLEERGMGVEFTSVEADSLDAVRSFVREVYELEDLDTLEPMRDEHTGRFSVSPRPQDALRLEADRPIPRASAREPAPEAEGRGLDRLVWSALLVLVGLLVGGGVVFLVMAG